MSGFPRWLKVAIPAAIVVIAVGVIAVGVIGIVAATTRTTTSSVEQFTEPAPPVSVSDPLSSVPPVSGGTLTARIELTAHTLAAGSTMPATVIVENSGAGFQVSTCGDYFVVVLANKSVPQSGPPQPQCLEAMTIPNGTSSYPITISASHTLCEEISGKGFPCLPGGGMPPLPPGEYRTILVEASSPPVPISVDPVVVTVT